MLSGDEIVEAIARLEALLTPEQKEERARKAWLRIKETSRKQTEFQRKQLQAINANKNRFYGGL